MSQNTATLDSYRRYLNIIEEIVFLVNCFLLVLTQIIAFSPKSTVLIEALTPNLRRKRAANRRRGAPTGRFLGFYAVVL